MYDLRNLREMLCKELDEIADKREMSAGDLDAIQKLTSSIKNTYKIEMAEDGGYSRDGEWEGGYARHVWPGQLLPWPPPRRNGPLQPHRRPRAYARAAGRYDARRGRR